MKICFMAQGAETQNFILHILQLADTQYSTLLFVRSEFQVIHITGFQMRTIFIIL